MVAAATVLAAPSASSTKQPARTAPSSPFEYETFTRRHTCGELATISVLSNRFELAFGKYSGYGSAAATSVPRRRRHRAGALSAAWRDRQNGRTYSLRNVRAILKSGTRALADGVEKAARTEEQLPLRDRRRAEGVIVEVV